MGIIKIMLNSSVALFFAFFLLYGCSSINEEKANLVSREIIKAEPMNFSPSQMEIEIWEKINEKRKEHGVGTLDFDIKASSVARAYSKRMLEEGFFDHYDKEGRNVEYRLKVANISYAEAGENLGLVSVGKESVNKVIDGWMKSKTHRETMLNENFSNVGVGVSCGKSLCYITTIYLNKLFKNILLPFKNNKNNGFITFSLPLNGIATRVEIEFNDTVDIILTNKSEVEKIKKDSPYSYFWKNKTDKAIITMLPDDILIIYSNNSIMADAKILD